jgi:hypothetical protein
VPNASQHAHEGLQHDAIVIHDQDASHWTHSVGETRGFGGRACLSATGRLRHGHDTATSAPSSLSKSP